MFFLKNWIFTYMGFVKVDISNLSLIFFVFKSFERFWICRFFKSWFGYVCFSDLEDFWGRRLPMSPFHNGSERFGKFLCLIFLHLVTFCCIKFIHFFQTKTLQTHTNLFDTKFIIKIHFCLMSFSLIYLFITCF